MPDGPPAPGRAGLAGQPAHPRHDPPAGLALPAPGRTPRPRSPRAVHPAHAPAPSPSAGRPASRPWSPTTRSTGWSAAPGRQATRGGRLLQGPAARRPEAGRPRRLDGDPATAWQPGFGRGPPGGVARVRPAGADHLRPPEPAGRRRRAPLGAHLPHHQHRERDPARSALPPIADGRVAGATPPVPLHFPALSGPRIRITVTGVRLEDTTNYYAPSPSPSRSASPRWASPACRSRRCRRPAGGLPRQPARHRRRAGERGDRAAAPSAAPVQR